MDRKLSRRGLLKGSAALIGGVAATSGSLASALARVEPTSTSIQGAPTLTWYALDPEWGAGLPGCPIDPAGAHASTHACHACTACHLHGANKLFASMEAADSNRAHLGCKCVVVAGGELAEDVWIELFGDPANVEREHVDRRWDWVADVLEGDDGDDGDDEIIFAHDAFERTWQRTDQPVLNGMISRTWMWAPHPFTNGMIEDYEEGQVDDGLLGLVSGQRLVQYFDKSRMEITDPNADFSNIWAVTNGLLVVELVSGRMQVGHDAFVEREPAIVNAAGDPDDPDGPTYATFAGVLDAPPLDLGSTIIQTIDRAGNVGSDPALAAQGVTVGHVDEVTNHSIAAPFWEFMNSSGLVYQDGDYFEAGLFLTAVYATGRPISEPYWAQVRVGGTQQLVLIQCLERRVLTYTPLNDPNWRVEAGNVGRHYYAWRYPSEM